MEKRQKNTVHMGNMNKTAMNIHCYCYVATSEISGLMGGGRKLNRDYVYRHTKIFQIALTTEDRPQWILFM